MAQEKVYLELPPFTGRNVPIIEIAKAMHKDAQYVRVGLQQGIFRFGYAIKLDDSNEYNYYYGLRGQYKTITGICWNVDTEVNHTIMIDRVKIPLGNVLKIEASGDLFRKDWDDPWTN